MFLREGTRVMQDHFNQLYRQMRPWKVQAFSNTVEGEWNKTIWNKFSKFSARRFMWWNLKRASHPVRGKKTSGLQNVQERDKKILTKEYFKISIKPVRDVLRVTMKFSQQMKDGAGLLCTNILTAVMCKPCYSGCLSQPCSSLTCTDLPGPLFTASCTEWDQGTNLAGKNPEVLTSWGWRLHVFSNSVYHSLC